MKVHIDIGGGEALGLAGGLMVYRSQSRAFCVWHEAVRADSGASRLGPAQALTTDFVRALAGELGVRIPIEVLPASTLVRTEEFLVWWTPPSCRAMFFRHADESVAGLSGRRFPQPPLVWAVSGHSLRVRALSKDERPTPATKLFVAPYYNTDGEDGLVCQGSMRSPENSGVAAFGQWEGAFFQSEFTHQTGVRKLTSHPSGFSGLWRGLGGKKRFPAEYLVPANESLLDFARRDIR